MKAKLAETETLLRIARATATLDLDDVLSRAASMTARALSAGRVVIYVVSADRRWLELAAATSKKTRRSRWPRGTVGPITAHVLKSGRIQHVRDLRKHPSNNAKTEPALSFISFVAIPLLLGQQRLGCLQVGEPDRLRTFTARETLLLTGIADLLAVAIHNARLASENRRRLQSLRRVSSRLWTVQEEERKRIAREIHDEAGQSLTALKLNLAMLRRELPAGSLTTRVDELIATSQSVLDALRSLSRDLRPPALDELGLVAALGTLVEGYGERTAVDLLVDLDQSIRLEGDAASTAFRFVQEALTNVARHAHSKHVRVAATKTSKGVLLTVEDDGKGFDTSRIGSGLGLAGMRERAQLVGGTLAIESTPGRGTHAKLLLRDGTGRSPRRKRATSA